MLPGFLTLLISLIVDASYSWARMLIALVASMTLGLLIGIWAARSTRAERLLLPIIDIFQTLPILAFFPFAILVFVALLPGELGINVAVVFLIITSMLWNIIFGVYEAIKTLPTEIMEVAKLYKMKMWSRFVNIYLPAALPKMAEQSALSWAIGLFYLVTSEIFSSGPSDFQVNNGIGVALTHLAAQGNFLAYGLGLLVFLMFVIATRYVIFVPFNKYASRWNTGEMKRKTGQVTTGGPMHRIKMLSEISQTYYKEETRVEKLAKRIAIRFEGRSHQKKTQVIVPLAANTTRVQKIIYLGFTVAIVLLILYLAGLINGNTIADEELALLSMVYTFSRVWLVFAAVVAVSVPVCVYLIFIRRNSESYMGLFQILASIPATIVLPVIVYLLAGNPELVAASVLFLSGIWYLVFSMMAGARTMPSGLFEVKKIFGINGTSAWKKIYLMAILPGLVTGAVTGIAAEWNATIVAEYFTSSGVGPGTVLSTVNVGIGKLLDISLSQNATTIGNYFNAVGIAAGPTATLPANSIQIMVIALINLTAMIIIVNTFVWKRFYKSVSRVYR